MTEFHCGDVIMYFSAPFEQTGWSLLPADIIRHYHEPRTFGEPRRTRRSSHHDVRVSLMKSVTIKQRRRGGKTAISRLDNKTV